MHCSEVTTIKIRKGYRCLWCWEHMPKGSEVKRWACFDGGSVSTVRMHDECYEAMRRWYTVWDDELPIPGTYPRGCCCEDKTCEDCQDIVNERGKGNDCRNHEGGLTNGNHKRNPQPPGEVEQ